MIVLNLPYPLSSNMMWRSYVPKGWNRASVYLTREYKQWKEAAGLIAKLAGVREPVTYSVALHVVHHHQTVHQKGKLIGRKNGKVYDLDNVLKVALDSLKGIVYVDDRQIKQILAEYGAPTEKGALTINITEFLEPRTYDILRPLGKKQDFGDLPF